MSKKVTILTHSGRQKVVKFASLIKNHNGTDVRGDIVGITFAEGQDLSGVGEYEHLSFVACNINNLVLPPVSSIQFSQCSIDDLTLTDTTYMRTHLTTARDIKVKSVGSLGVNISRSQISGLVAHAEDIRIASNHSELANWDLSNVPVLSVAEITDATSIYGLITPANGMKVSGDINIRSCPQPTWDTFDERFILQGLSNLHLHVDAHHTSVVSTVRREKDSKNSPIRISAEVVGGDSNDSLLCDPSDLIGILPIHRYSKTDEDEYTDVVAFTGNLVSIGCQHLPVKKARLVTKFFSDNPQSGQDSDMLSADDAVAHFVHIVEDEDSRRELVAHWGPILLQIIDAMKKQRKRTIKHLGEFQPDSTIVMGV